MSAHMRHLRELMRERILPVMRYPDSANRYLSTNRMPVLAWAMLFLTGAAEGDLCG